MRHLRSGQEDVCRNIPRVKELIMDIISRMNAYFDTAFPLTKPKWTTENEIVLQTKALILRRFGKKSGRSTVIVPPQAGHSSHIADYDVGQSIVETVLSERDGTVYCIEWLSATQGRKNESIGDLLRQLDGVFEFIGERSNLIGLCQGGWLSAMYAATFQAKVLSLTCIAAPIDFHSGGGTIYDTVTKLGMAPYKFFVYSNNGIMSGDNMLTGWKMMNPVDRYIVDYIKILGVLDDDEKLRKIKRFRTWYEYTQDLSGVWYLEAVEELFLNNLLIKKRFKFNNKVVDLSKIKCPVYAIAGQKDDITLTTHLFPLCDIVSSKKTYKTIIPNSGHVGCFMGTSSQKYVGESIRSLDKLSY